MTDGTMYSGREFSDGFATPSFNLGLSRDVANQLPVAARAVIPQNNNRLLNFGLQRQGGFDLARFDPEATPLQLIISTTEELDIAVGQEAAPGRPSGTTGRRQQKGWR